MLSGERLYLLSVDHTAHTGGQVIAASAEGDVSGEAAQWLRTVAQEAFEMGALGNGFPEIVLVVEVVNVHA